MNISQQTHQRWINVENESWTDVHLSTLFQRWQNNVETTSIELRRINVDEPTLFQRWNLVGFFQHWQNNVETTLKESRGFNVNEPMLFQRWYLVENESWFNICLLPLLQHWENSIERISSIFAASMFARKWLSYKTKLSFHV